MTSSSGISSSVGSQPFPLIEEKDVQDLHRGNRKLLIKIGALQVPSPQPPSPPTTPNQSKYWCKGSPPRSATPVSSPSSPSSEKG